MPPYSPDLTWWLGSAVVSWQREADCWGSDHHPIRLGIAPNSTCRLRRSYTIVNWDEFRCNINATMTAPSTDPTTVIKEALSSASRRTWVEESRPNPDLRLLQLWAQRKQAEVAASRDPWCAPARMRLQRLTAAARRHEKRLSRQRWLSWCESLGPSSTTLSIWRTFRAMESGGHTPDTAASACLASGKNPDQFAFDVVRALYPAFDIFPASNPCPFPLPRHVGASPSDAAVRGTQSAFTMAEFLAAIDQAKIR